MPFIEKDYNASKKETLKSIDLRLTNLHLAYDQFIFFQATIQILYDKGIFDDYDSADDTLDCSTFNETRSGEVAFTNYSQCD